MNGLNNRYQSHGFAIHTQKHNPVGMYFNASKKCIPKAHPNNASHQHHSRRFAIRAQNNNLSLKKKNKNNLK